MLVCFSPFSYFSLFTQYHYDEIDDDYAAYVLTLYLGKPQTIHDVKTMDAHRKQADGVSPGL